MKMRKLLSIGAIALALVSCTSIGASAEEVLNNTQKNEDVQLKLMIKKGIDGENVINGLAINAKTPLKNYLKPAAIDKINTMLSIADVKLKAPIADTDTYNDIIASVAVAIKDLPSDQKTAKIEAIKDQLTKESKDYKGMTDEALLDTFKSYLNVDKYGTLRLYTNMNGGRTVSLESSKGNVVLQINKDNLKGLKNKVGNDLSAEHIKQLVNEYAPQYADMF